MSLGTGCGPACFVPLHVVHFIRIQGWGVLRGACVSSSCTGTILLLLPHQCTEVLTQLHLTSWKTLRSAGSLCFTEGCVCVGLVLC